LNPWPGYVYSAVPAQYVTPDVIVEKVDGQYVVRLTNERLPELRVSNPYAASMRKQGVTEEEREYIRQKLESANWIRRNIAQRQQTILKVAQCIVDFQSEFLENGVEHIRPLTLQNIADLVGVHESTVARTTRGKYIQTPQGLFELKYFFCPGLAGENGEMQSSKSLQALVRKIVEEENKSKPFSDQKIADLIRKREGTNIARRTVTKYREGMNIAKASMRREY
jgi:RNA polymerase sigma-54 factor